MSGTELLQSIRFGQPDASKQIPAIAITSYTREFALTEITRVHPSLVSLDLRQSLKSAYLLGLDI